MQHQGGPRAGSWVLGWVSLPWAHHSQPPPVTKDSTDSERYGCSPGQRAPGPSSLQPPPKIIHWLCWGMENAHLPSAPDTGDTARLGGSQGHPAVLLCGANPSRNTLLIHLHRSRGTAKEEKLSGARRCLHMGRETNSEHRAG